MESLFRFLEANLYILLSFVVGRAVGIRRLTIESDGLGMVASMVAS